MSKNPGGPYLHQQAMMDAVKRLYMLGNRAYHPKEVRLGDDLAESFGAIRGSYEDHKRKEDAVKQLRTVEKHAGDTGGVGRSMRGGASDYAVLANDGLEAYDNLKERREVAAGRAIPQNPERNIYDDAISAQEKNEMAQHARIGGQYTLKGLQKTQKDADDQGHDIVYGQQLYGLGGSIPSQNITNPPPDYMHNYRINGGY